MKSFIHMVCYFLKVNEKIGETIEFMKIKIGEVYKEGKLEKYVKNTQQIIYKQIDFLTVKRYQPL